MKPLGCHHLNVFSRTCSSYPTVLWLKELFKYVSISREEKADWLYMCILWVTQKWLSLIKSPHWQTSHLFKFIWTWCFSHHLFSAQKKHYPGYLLEGWVVTSFTARRTKLVLKGLILCMVRLCQGAAKGGCSAESWGGSKDGRTNVLASKGTASQWLSKDGRNAGNELMMTWVSQQCHHSHTNPELWGRSSDCDTELFSPAADSIHWPEEEAEWV